MNLNIFKRRSAGVPKHIPDNWIGRSISLSAAPKLSGDIIFLQKGWRHSYTLKALTFGHGKYYCIEESSGRLFHVSVGEEMDWGPDATPTVDWVLLKQLSVEEFLNKIEKEYPFRKQACLTALKAAHLLQKTE